MENEQTETYNGKDYLVWDTRREVFTKSAGEPLDLVKVPEGTAPEGRFLVDPETGKVAYLKDPTIGGKIKEVGGKELTRFDAPKTQVMKIIISGVLERKLNWSLVLIGALMAVTLELCGVSSLAFAVGVYVPIQYSTPIFIGGLARYFIDRYQSRVQQAEGEAKIQRAIAEAQARGADVIAAEQQAKAEAEVDAIRKSETSPGVLLASGYIAGGSLAGVVAAFLEFSPSLKEKFDFSKSVAGLDTAPIMGPFTQADLVAMLLFAVLVGFMVLVGMGKLFRAPEEMTIPPEV